MPFLFGKTVMSMTHLTIIMLIAISIIGFDLYNNCRFSQCKQLYDY
jgi:hypothetical protein